jgi:DNA-binding CsgD family transcriptional regulator
MRERGEPPEALAHHVEQSACVGDEQAVGLLAEAGGAVANRAPGLAARWFEGALRTLGPGASDLRRLELLIALASAQAASGRLLESHESMTRVLDLIPGEAIQVRVQVLARMAQAEAMLGLEPHARELLSAALERDSGMTAQDRAALLVELSSDWLRANDFEGAAERAAAGLAGARAAGDRALQAVTASGLAWAEYGRGSISTARAYADEATALVDALSPGELAQRLDAPLALSAALVGLGRSEAALERSEAALSIARAAERSFMVPQLLFSAARAQIWLGRLEEAAETAEAALESASVLGIDHLLAWAWFGTGWVALVRGDVTAAIAAATKAIEAGAGAPGGLFGHLGPALLGEAYVAAGQPSRGRDTIVAAAGGPDLPAFEAGARARWYETLVEAELALGDTCAALGWAERAQAIPLQGDLPTHRAFVARIRASLAGGGAAVAAAREAIAGFDSGGLRVESARTRILLGTALREQGAGREAIAELERALSELEACGANRLRDAAARELRRLARRVSRTRRRAAPEAGFAALSVREREVADLVALGQTNREIAATLFLSSRTVENHLSSVFRKLDVGSRAEVAREVTRHADHR